MLIFFLINMRSGWDPGRHSVVLGFLQTHWGYTGSAQGLGCEVQLLRLRTKPATDKFFLTELPWCLVSLTRCHPQGLKRGLKKKKKAFLLLLLFCFFFFFVSAPIAVARLRSSEGSTEEFWGINLMGSDHVWSWMWFLGAKRREWRGMKTDRVKQLRAKGWCSRRLWPDRTQRVQMDCWLTGCSD